MERNPWKEFFIAIILFAMFLLVVHPSATVKSGKWEKIQTSWSSNTFVNWVSFVIWWLYDGKNLLFCIVSVEGMYRGETGSSSLDFLFLSWLKTLAHASLLEMKLGLSGRLCERFSMASVYAFTFLYNLWEI